MGAKHRAAERDLAWGASDAFRTVAPPMAAAPMTAGPGMTTAPWRAFEPVQRPPTLAPGANGAPSVAPLPVPPVPVSPVPNGTGYGQPNGHNGNGHNGHPNGHNGHNGHSGTATVPTGSWRTTDLRPVPVDLPVALPEVRPTQSSGVPGLWLAEEFFFVCHDDRTGKPRLHPRAVGLGVGAALLGELVLWQRILLRDGLVVAVDPRPPLDGLARAVLQKIINERSPLPVTEWLAFLAGSGVDAVAERLVSAGLARPEYARRGLRRTVRYMPTDPNGAAWPAARLGQFLGQRRPLSIQDTTLAGLVLATGLTPHVFYDASGDDLARLEQSVTGLWRPLRVLIAETEAAVGNAVLSVRP